MKKLVLLCLSLVAALGAVAEITVCGVGYDDNGHFYCPFIKSGSITWDEGSRTLTLNNAVVEYSSESPYDYINPIRVTEDATNIVIQGECKLTTTGFNALSIDGTNSKNVTIKGNGSLSTSSTLMGIYLKCARLTIKDITLQTSKGIRNNGDGVLCALKFDNAQADINGVVEHIGEAITFTNCAITYPADAYIDHDDYGYYIADGSGNTANHIIISRSSGIKGDVNGDGEVNIADVNAVIDLVLRGGSNTAADVNQDGEINIADVNAVIEIVLNGSAPQQDHEYVDLGLPSGTLWATCNVGANRPEDYGDYFAWGETTPKEEYNLDTYKWGYYDENRKLHLTKYNMTSAYGPIDNKNELDPEDDAAYVNWGPSWRMPSKDQLSELASQCYWQWTTRNEVAGLLVTGPNGNTLFWPTAGYRSNTMLYSSYFEGLYWSRTLYYSYSDGAYRIRIGEGMHNCNIYNRYFGYSVRPVRVTQN